MWFMDVDNYVQGKLPPTVILTLTGGGGGGEFSSEVTVWMPICMVLYVLYIYIMVWYYGVYVLYVWYIFIICIYVWYSPLNDS